MRFQSRERKRILSSFAAIGLMTVAAPAWAQMQPTPLPQPTSPRPDKKPEGVAEKAPSEPGALPTTLVLPPPKAKKKKYQLLDLDGYFRFRGDWFKNLHLGFKDDPNLGGAPFLEPLACKSNKDNAPCERTLKSSNIRLRVEPNLNLSETASVHLQIDVMDNFVLGSTPDGTFGNGVSSPTNIPLPVFSDGQVPPQTARNYIHDSIRIKRAWGEVMTSLGLVRFGRQPIHWGIGILANAGGADPFHGTYDLDSDYGDSVDRVFFSTVVPGTDYRLGVGTDWQATAPTAAHVEFFQNRYDGQPWDLEDNDDVNQWVIVLARIDSAEKYRDRLDQGELAVNYGTYFLYRTQGWDYNPAYDLGKPPDPTQFVPRSAKAYIPDVWFRLGYRKLALEFEGVGTFGSITTLTDVVDGGFDQPLTLRQFGAVGRLSYGGFEDKLNLTLEAGYASGDQWDNSPQGTTNVRNARVLVADKQDTTLSAFRFDFDYEIDLILFRELFRTITNATYVRPQISYKFTDSITFKAQSVVSFANVPVATPGNGLMYGIELDGDLGYGSDNFFAGISYGILFPLAAMNHPEDVLDPTSPRFGAGFNYGTGNIGDAGNAQTIQSRLVLKF